MKGGGGQTHFPKQTKQELLVTSRSQTRKSHFRSQGQQTELLLGLRMLEILWTTPDQKCWCCRIMGCVKWSQYFASFNWSVTIQTGFIKVSPRLHIINRFSLFMYVMSYKWLPTQTWKTKRHRLHLVPLFFYFKNHLFVGMSYSRVYLLYRR